jgi:hypothetical protein
MPLSKDGVYSSVAEKSCDVETVILSTFLSHLGIFVSLKEAGNTEALKQDLCGGGLSIGGDGLRGQT